MKSGLRLAQALLASDGVLMVCYGLFSLLLVPGAVGESYLSPSRYFYGVLPNLLGLASLTCAIWLAFVQRRESVPR